MFSFVEIFSGARSNGHIMEISPGMTSSMRMFSTKVSGDIYSAASDLQTKVVNVIWRRSPRKEYVPPTMRIMYMYVNLSI